MQLNLENFCYHDVSIKKKKTFAPAEWNLSVFGFHFQQKNIDSSQKKLTEKQDGENKGK